MDFAVLSVDRHRMKTDGKGITTLVALAGCPLKCPFCINKEWLAAEEKIKRRSVNELVEELAIDHCYFLYTGGGVTFGGGEPLLHSNQIAKFSEVCPSEWSINIETSLNVPPEQLQPVLTERFSYIIDCKAMQADIYMRYTGTEIGQMLHNLQQIVRKIPQERYVVKVPLIPEYSTGEDVEESIKCLRELGVPKDNIVTFKYRTF